jgi:hypothetical protein
MSNAIAFHGTITSDVFLKAQRLHSKRRSVAFLVVAFAAILFGLLIRFKDEADLGSLTLIAAGVTMIVLLALRRFRTRRIYEKSPYMHEAFRGSISPSAYSVETSVGSGTVPWSKFIKVLADDEIVLLYRGPNMFNIMAKDFFNSDEEWQQARKLALEMGGRS